MNGKKIALATIIIWLAGIAYMWLTCGWLFNWIYMEPPLIWKSPESMMSMGTLIGSNVAGLLIAFLFVLVYAMLFKGIPGKGVNKGMMYGVIVWLVGALSGMATMPFYMTIALVVVVYWIISALVFNLIAGAILGGIYKK